MATHTPLRLATLRAALTTLTPCRRFHHSQMANTSSRYKSTRASEDEIDLDQPIKFSTSRAATWRARDTFGSRVSESEMPWYQPYVVSASLTTFLLYFCVFREESDVDNSLRKTLYDHIEGLEEQQLELSLAHTTQIGKDTSNIRARLREIREAKQDKTDPA